MFKIGFLFLGIFLGLFGLGLYFHTNPVQKTKANYTNLSPKDVVLNFWIASYKGREEIVEELITSTPPSFNHVCEENGVGRSQYGTLIDDTNSTQGISLNDDNSNSASDVTEKAFSENEKFFQKPNTGAKWLFALTTAKFIYYSQIPLAQINVIDEVIYNNEAIVDLEYKIMDTKVKERFLLINQEGWKVFLSSPPDSTIIDNKFYGQSRPKCK